MRLNDYSHKLTSFWANYADLGEYTDNFRKSN